MHVIKFNGEKENFVGQKIYKAAKMSGVPDVLAKRISETIEKNAYNGIKTSEIFRMTKNLLLKDKPTAAIRVNLRKAMLKLGPAGFPFEKYIGNVLKEIGFKTKINQYIGGRCCRYEIDFVAQKNDSIYIGECKYRNNQRHRVDLGVSLKNYARFLDIKNGNSFKNKTKLKSLIVTNAKFTSQAIKYAKCVNVDLLGWKYPKKRSLEKIIDDYRLYPVTILYSLNNYQAKKLIEQKITTIQDILKKSVEYIYKYTGIPKNKINMIKKQAKDLLEK